MNPKVSVIVPIYNVEKYIDRCLSSLINQTLKDIEIILVDDESPDNCPQICDRYATEYANISVIHKKNGGLGMARNSGLEFARGEYVAFIDSDDYIDSNSLECLYSFSKKNNLDICYGSFCYEMDDGRSIPKYEINEETLIVGRNEIDKFKLDMVGPCPNFARDVKYSVSVCKCIFRLDVFRKNSLSFDSEKIMASEDFLFHLNILSLVNRIGLIPICYYHYCENGSSISHTYSEAKFNRIVLSMYEIKRRLSSCFLQEKYLIHFQRCLFLSLRGVLSHEVNNSDCSFFQKLSNLKYRCANDAYKDLFRNYPYWKLGFAKALLYLSMKYRLSMIIYAILYIKQRLKK